MTWVPAVRTPDARGGREDIAAGSVRALPGTSRRRQPRRSAVTGSSLVAASDASTRSFSALPLPTSG